MAQLIRTGPPISFANFSNRPGRFCESCEDPYLLDRFRSYRSVTLSVQLSGQLTGTLVLLEIEERGDRFGLVADRVCERCYNPVGQVRAVLAGRPGRVDGRDDLQLVAQCDRRLVFDRDPQRTLEQGGVRGEVVLDHAPVDRVVHVVEQIYVGHPDGEFVDFGGPGSWIAAPRLQVTLPPQPVDGGGLVQAGQEVVRDARR